MKAAKATAAAVMAPNSALPAPLVLEAAASLLVEEEVVVWLEPEEDPEEDPAEDPEGDAVEPEDPELVEEVVLEEEVEEGVLEPSAQVSVE
jgi:hypothetical protein